jgi:hypothetical protein
MVDERNRAKLEPNQIADAGPNTNLEPIDADKVTPL